MSKKTTLLDEIKSQFTTFKDAGKRDQEDEIYQREKVREIEKTKKESYSKLLEKSEEQNAKKAANAGGRTVNSISQKNKPAKSITVNESATVKVMEPKEMEDAYLIISELKDKQAVIVKLGSVDSEVCKRILDNIYGACNFANYYIEKIDTKLILIDPTYQEVIR